MKIGIFGDSFGDKSRVPETSTSKAWTTYIAEEFDIDNHCVSGSSFYYSAKLFLKTHHLYDKIIFLVTDLGRLEVPPNFGINIKQSTISSITHATEMAEETGNIIYKVAADYFFYFSDLDKEGFFQYAAIDKLRSIRKENILFLPCFFYSVDEQDRKNNELFRIASLDETNSISEKSGRIDDTRHCHFNDQNNIIFANNIKNWILNGVWNFNINDYVSMSIVK